MKGLKTFFLIITVINSVFSQDYFYTSYSSAIKKAKEENKRVFLDFSATWCGPCKMMEQKVFPDTLISNYLQKNYVCVKFMHDRSRDLFESYGIKSFPTFVILENSGKEIYRFTGYNPAKQFYLILKSIPFRSNEKEKFDSLYDYNKNNLEFLYEYNEILKKNRYFGCAKKISKRILKKSDNWFTNKNMKLILENFNESSSYKRFYLKNKAVFIDSLGEDFVDQQLLDAYFKKNFANQFRWEYINIKEIKREFKKLMGDEYKKYLSYYFMNLLERKPEYKNYYISSSLYYLESSDSLFKTNGSYYYISTLIFKLSSNLHYKEMYKAILHQFNFGNVALDYYDIKAFLEYILGMEDEAVKTIQEANIKSMEKYKTPYKSMLNALIQADRVLHPKEIKEKK